MLNLKFKHKLTLLRAPYEKSVAVKASNIDTQIVLVMVSR